MLVDNRQHQAMFDNRSTFITDCKNDKKLGPQKNTKALEQSKTNSV